jgi:SpoVK/Ycf46/Vps4 family AAA+-type ATPase
MEILSKLQTLVRAAYPIIYVETIEEERLISELSRTTEERGIDLFSWDIQAGFRQYKPGEGFILISDEQEPTVAITENFIDAKVNGILMLPDIHRLFHDAATVRLLRNCLALRHRDDYVKMFLLSSPFIDLPVELRRQVATVEYPLPTKDEIKGYLLDQAEALPQELYPADLQKALSAAKKVAVDKPGKGFALSMDKLPVEGMSQLVDACRGLTLLEIENVMAKCLNANIPFTPPVFIEEKKEILRGSKSLEYIESPLTLRKDVGGLENVIDWLELRRKAFTPAAAEFGIPAPKGVLLIGPPGTGKSLVAKCIGGSYGFPIIRFNMGAAFSKWQGESEAEIRNAWSTAEACAPCILVCDEIDKATGGMGGDGDNGTGNRILGDLLTKMQDNDKGVVVVATCNDVQSMPPALLRKGRFDEIIFVDLPGPKAVKQILEIHLLGKKQPKLSTFTAEEQESIVQHMLGMTGAEVEQAIIDAMFFAFNEERKLSAADLVKAATNTRPYCVLKEEAVKWLRDWARNRAIPASSEELDLAKVLAFRKSLGQTSPPVTQMSMVKRLRAKQP